MPHEQIPSSQPFLSLCMIVKNEGKNLGRCLASAQPYVDEIVIIDTGSTDDTIAIAQQYGAKLDYFAWCDDFAAARNYSLTKVSGVWILHLDADEELVVSDRNFRQQLHDLPQVNPDILAFAVTRNDVNVPADAFLGGFHVRLFRNLPEFRYVNRYHEQLEYQSDRPIAYHYLQGIEILHYGNSDAAALRQKTLTRDIPILEAIQQQEGLNFWLLDCLARNYLRTDQPKQAANCYQEAMDRLLPHLLSGEKPDSFYWVSTLMHYLAEEALAQNDWETARMLCQRGLEWNPTHLPFNYLTGQILLDLGFALGATAYFERCLHLAETQTFYTSEPFDRSLLDLAPALSLGQAHLTLNQPASAIAAFEFALAVDPNCTIAQESLAQLRQSSDLAAP